ncbi:MAG: filamentous hemagglutinin N-terminal domain-containing protein, partial [Candidatus Omnitrophica bacterium]|nr:filamentous hemagglutinin N-terminal domain-containing protein [Candidatus Omnitrophota bacterium]
MKVSSLLSSTVLIFSLLACSGLYAEEAAPEQGISPTALPVVIDPGTVQVVTDINTNTQTWTAADSISMMDLASGNVGSQARLEVYLPTDDSRLLAKVLGNDPTYWNGNIYCPRGLFVFENQNGINIGPQAQINVNNLIATTLDISANNFLNGNYILEHNVNSRYAYILNEGRITVSNIALIASAVCNGDNGVLVAKVGTVNLASGDKVTVSFDMRGLMQVEVNDKTTGKVLDMQGNDVKDAIKNLGTIEATQVMMSAKTANDIFENAVNNTGIVKATGMIEVNGVIKIVADGNINANLAGATSNIEVNRLDQDISISACTRIGDLITIEGNGLKVTYMVTSDFTLKTDGAIDSTAGAILQGNSVTLIANRFGSTVTPLQIDSPTIHIKRTVGDIDILESVGIGTSVQITGPPDGFGKIIYPKTSSLILEATRTTVSTDQNPAQFFGNITFYNFECATSGKVIYFEAGKTYTFEGAFKLQGATDACIKLLSSDKGNPWYVSTNGSENLTAIWVEDSINISEKEVITHLSTLREGAVRWDADYIWVHADADGTWSDVTSWKDGTGNNPGSMPGAN